MKCEDLRQRLWAYFEGKLPADERVALDDHAARCPACGPLLEKCAELTCRDFTEFLHDYIENRLAPERERVFERHLSVCADCEAYLDAYRKSIALARSQRDVELGDVPDELLRAVLDAWSKSEDETG